MVPTPEPLPENRLLRAMPAGDREALLSLLEPVELEYQSSLYLPEQAIEHVYFVSSGVVSMISRMEDGAVVEVATVGSEGMVGIPVFLGSDSTPLEAFVQVPGDGYRMSSEALKREVEQGGALAALLLRYTQALFFQIAQGAACNRMHPIETRCARWILMTQDRVRLREFPLRQEFLAQMLGVGRPSVSIAASQLQRAGFIRYSRGRLTVTDREGLETAACECYGLIRKEYDRMYPE